MKYRIFTYILILALVVSPAYALAQTAPAQTGVFDAPATLSLTARKQFVETSLTGVLAQMTSVYLRTQTATDRLGTNNIDIAAATTLLTKARTSLVEAKMHLTIFTATPVDEKPATVATLKLHAKDAEESLVSARDNIIASIQTLKLTLQAR